MMTLVARVSRLRPAGPWSASFQPRLIPSISWRGFAESSNGYAQSYLSPPSVISPSTRSDYAMQRVLAGALLKHRLSSHIFLRIIRSGSKPSGLARPARSFNDRRQVERLERHLMIS